MLKYKPGKTIRGYNIVREISAGAFALSYQAEKDGRKLFFRQYKSPGPATSWFEAYVDYASEIKRRIQASEAARTRCYEMVEFFVERDFCQVFEFVEGGMSLSGALERVNEFDWNTRITFAKVMMGGISALHEVGVVHSDLKPDNIYLIPDPSIGVGYRLRIVDLEFAILVDKPAPWLADRGYFGTPGYRSPEHLRGKMPTPKSDVFTCGIMLSQILCGVHPHAAATLDAMEATALAGSGKTIRISQAVKRVEDVAFLEGVLNSCLCPDPERRPTVNQVADALLGKTFSWEPWFPGTPAADDKKTSGPTTL